MFTIVAVLVGPMMAVASALPTTSVPVDGQAAVDAAVAAFDDFAVVWTVDEDQRDELASDVAWFGSKAAAACLDAALEQSVADDAPGDGTIPRPSAGAVTTASVQDLGVGDTSSAITVGIDISVAEPDVALEYAIAFSAVQVGTTGFLVFHGLYSEHDGELDVAVSTDALTTMVDAIG